MKNYNLKEIKDLVTYLEHIDILSKTMDKAQQKSLSEIFKTFCILLIGFKKGTGIGKVKLPWDNVYEL